MSERGEEGWEAKEKERERERELVINSDGMCLCVIDDIVSMQQ